MPAFAEDRLRVSPDAATGIQLFRVTPPGYLDRKVGNLLPACDWVAGKESGNGKGYLGPPPPSLASHGPTRPTKREGPLQASTSKKTYRATQREQPYGSVDLLATPHARGHTR